MHIIQKMRPFFAVIDLNVILYNRRSFAFRGATDEHSTIRLRPDHGLPSSSRVSEMRPAVSWGLQGPKIFVPRSVLLSGFRPTDLSGKPPRYRLLLESREKPALSHGHPRPHLSQQLGQLQQSTRLAHLRRLCPGAHRRGPSTLPRRGYRLGARRYDLRLRFHDDRPVSVAFPLGSVPQTQGRHQAPYASRPEGLDTNFYPYNTRKNARCSDPRRSPARAGFLLHPGSRISGLLSTLHPPSEPRVFCHPGHVESYVASNLVSTRPQNHGPDQRPEDPADRPQIQDRLSRRDPSGSGLRPGGGSVLERFSQ